MMALGTNGEMIHPRRKCCSVFTDRWEMCGVAGYASKNNNDNNGISIIGYICIDGLGFLGHVTFSITLWKQ
jgi:hypothetical protein